MKLSTKELEDKIVELEENIFRSEKEMMILIKQLKNNNSLDNRMFSKESGACAICGTTTHLCKIFTFKVFPVPEKKIFLCDKHKDYDIKEYLK